MKILVIEDEKGIRDNIKVLLESENFTVVTARNGKDGIDKAITHKPDLIICDIMMPGTDGYGVIETLQNTKGFAAIPFIFLTAKVERSDLRTGMRLGADDYIFKPYEAEDLLNAVKTRINKSGKIRATIKEELNSHKKYTLSDKIIFRVGDNSFPVPIASITYISAERQYSNVNTVNNKKYIIKKSICGWEESLPADSFVRIHRSTLINLNHVNKIQKHSNGAYKIHINNSELVLEVSRRFYKNLKNFDI